MHLNFVVLFKFTHIDVKVSFLNKIYIYIYMNIDFPTNIN
jgi:hypothetical protein